MFNAVSQSSSNCAETSEINSFHGHPCIQNHIFRQTCDSNSDLYFKFVHRAECFPSEFQKAKVIPLAKARDHKNLNDYRPISLLSVLSKLLERHVHRHLVTYLVTRDLFHSLQSGFRRKHSCNTALARLIDSWLSAINRSDLSGDVFLDLKKKSIRSCWSQNLTLKAFCLFKQFELTALFSVHTLKIE